MGVHYAWPCIGHSADTLTVGFFCLNCIPDFFGGERNSTVHLRKCFSVSKKFEVVLRDSQMIHGEVCSDHLYSEFSVSPSAVGYAHVHA